jgi:hypothetical protein
VTHPIVFHDNELDGGAATAAAAAAAAGYRSSFSTTSTLVVCQLREDVHSSGGEGACGLRPSCWYLLSLQSSLECLIGLFCLLC